MSESTIVNFLQNFELLASALSGKEVRVAQGTPVEPAWTDGKTIFIDTTLSERDQLTAILVQASLLSAGSLAPDILRKLKRHSDVAIRYFAIESQRALNANAALLPSSIQSYIDKKFAARSDSVDTSLAMASGCEEIAVSPPSFGTINVKRLLAVYSKDKNSELAQTQMRVHAPSPQHDVLEELEDDAIDDSHASDVAVDKFSVGGAAGVIGRWLQRLLSAVRQGSASGTPGTDAPTHRASNVTPRVGFSVWSTATVDVIDEALAQSGSVTYPEWDMCRRDYRQDWCSVKELEPSIKNVAQPALPDVWGLVRPLARVGLGLEHCHRQAQGDDIDIDAAIEMRVEVMAGSIPDEAAYVDSRRYRRDLSVLILLDISGSVAEPDSQGKTVHEQQRAAAAALTSVLHNLGDRVALYAFNSRGRSSVQLTPVKRFEEHFNLLTMQRLHSLEPCAYSRMGAAIRHGAAVLEAQGGTPRRLLLVLSDGLAYDHGYEKDYGAADARRALTEARHRGIGSVCLTIGATTDADLLQRVFGSTAHGIISRPEQMSNVIGFLFRSALRAAEVRRPMSAQTSKKSSTN